MKKLFLIITILLNILDISLDIILGYFIFKYDVNFYYMTLFFIMGIGLGNLIIMIIHLLIDKTYTFKKYTPIMHASYLIIAGIIYYAIEWIGKYNEYSIVYWLILALVIIIDLIVFVIINNLKTNENKPNIKVNQ